MIDSKVYKTGKTCGEVYYLVATVNAVYQQLPPGERAHAQILTTNWGEAGEHSDWRDA